MTERQMKEYFLIGMVFTLTAGLFDLIVTIIECL